MKQEKLSLNDVLIRPIITEKALILREQRKYVFEVNPLANKNLVKEAVEKLFNVKVEKVNILNMKPKPKRRGIFEGKTRSWKKAVVTLKEGYTIKELEGEH
ncbi:MULTISPECIES: 50S ribosomal protein L23 [Thermotoga]|jgi:large subunit ribosomal protein L23|uniref:Large ribosomal subunit protein uL23 n=4 Tax=Thermotoga TaxID=2335 RepID=RL23_THEP1|nr:MULTISPECIES: 50S ribosomal protein L23 [Thermotoga]A5IM85.1 RecName: Full=Large ribosomal subunit protein uL23; AltName: Full=50S ribosomal protein L23 [Thermotoga petrophila RKU-1]B1LBN8.1 RecName: Full=Large ribosomal subunit protein uL23; AltName: Full=50S ribosomal protein L23 [Thermotoga sp. RQ2]KUK22885.1 MAG: 50S ribosomal protein L23 [Thermotoga petrophila]KUK33835.1 MAG: 50S ribosomal protein L23 [Thermotoga sp. 47_83]MBZ4661305.1 Ribosomal protein [Thermotoga sp.]ABQ47308.1 LSU 